MAHMGFRKIRGLSLVVPTIRSHSILWSILGPLVLGNSHVPHCEVGARGQHGSCVQRFQSINSDKVLFSACPLSFASLHRG